jgi:hypothetical protein
VGLFGAEDHLTDVTSDKESSTSGGGVEARRERRDVTTSVPPRLNLTPEAPFVHSATPNSLMRPIVATHLGGGPLEITLRVRLTRSWTTLRSTGSPCGWARGLGPGCRGTLAGLLNTALDYVWFDIYSLTGRTLGLGHPLGRGRRCLRAWGSAVVEMA